MCIDDEIRGVRKPAYFLPITEIPLKHVREHIDKNDLVSDSHNLTIRADPLLDVETLKKAALAFSEEGRRKAFEYLASEAFGTTARFSDAYLSTVTEELGNDAPKVESMDAFPDIDTNVRKALTLNGITDSRLCYLRLRDRRRRRGFSARNHLQFDELQKAYAMTEIFQILGVSPTLASLLVRCGVGSAVELAREDPSRLLTKLKQEAARKNESFPYNEADAKNCILFAKTWIIARGEDC